MKAIRKMLLPEAIIVFVQHFLIRKVMTKKEWLGHVA